MLELCPLSEDCIVNQATSADIKLNENSRVELIIHQNTCYYMVSEVMAEQIPAPKPINFDGNVSENWRRWRQQYELYMIATEKAEKSEKLQCATFLTLAGETAIEIYNTMAFPADEKDKINPLVEKFEEYCTPRRNETYERHIFTERNQKPGETIDQFVTELRILVKNCAYGELTNSIIRDRIVEGIYDDGTRSRLLREGTLTLEKCIDICRAAERANRQMKMLTDEASGAAKEAHAVLARNPPLRPQRSESTICSNCGYIHRGQTCPATGKTCNKCGKRNHFKKMCRSREVSRQRAPVHSVETHQADSEDEYCVFSLETDFKSERWIVPISVNETIIPLKLDTGSDVNILSEADYNSIPYRPKLKPTKIRLKAYDGGEIAVKGQCVLRLKFRERDMKMLFIVSPENVKPILGRKSSENLGLIKRVFTVDRSVNTDKDEKQTNNSMFKEYADVFQGLGCLQGEISITLKDNAKPVIEACRRVPFPIQEKLKKELDRMESLCVIEKVEEPTEWVSSLVVVTKPNGNLRICLDPRNLNNSIKREHFKLPTREEITSRFANAKVFSKLDASSGFWQLKLDDASSKLCTFNTPFGRYKYLRLPFGVSCAPEIYHRTVHRLFETMDGVDTSMDDIIIWGSDQNEHDERLVCVLDKVREVGLKLQKDKCEISVPELTFIGDKITADGLKPDPKKVEAIKSMERPENKTELQRFLGMINYLARYLPDLSKQTAPLRVLLDKENEWMWQHEQETAWTALKTLISSDQVLKFYDPSKPVKISCDASKQGLGAVLLQQHDDEWLPVAYASRSVTETESRYAPIEMETLAITFACERFHQFIFGQQIEVETDHKPLVAIFKKALNDSPLRIQRLRIRLQKYDFSLVYKPGKWMHAADTLSRSPVPTDTSDSETEVQAYVDSIMSSLMVTDKTQAAIQQETETDGTLRKLKHRVQYGCPDDKSSYERDLLPFWNYREELSVHRNMILKGSSIIVPVSMRKEMMNKIHAGHLGQEKCKRRARRTIFWPGINNEIDEMVSKCDICQKYRYKQQKEPLKPYPVATSPWQAVATDLFEIDKKEYIVIVDAYSSFPEVVPLNSQTSSAVIRVMKETFARHGIPEVVYSDNGPCYSSQEFIEFSKQWDFQHITSSPGMPSSNGLAEKSVQTVKNIIRKSKESGEDPLMGLLAYRTTPMSNDRSPAEMLMNRTPRANLPVSKSSMKGSRKVVQWKKQSKIKQKYYHDQKARPQKPLIEGDRVRLFKPEKSQWGVKAEILKHVSPRSYELRTETGGECRRNRRHLLQIPNAIKPMEMTECYTSIEGNQPIELESSECETPTSESDIKTRSGRIIKKPERLIEAM